MSALQRHAGLRQALVALAQLALAAAVYTLAALAWRDLAGGHGRPGLVTVLLATAVVGAALAATRRRTERLVNWLAFGRRVDSYELASGFLKRLATSLEVDDVLPRLAETVARTVGSRRGEVHVWLADGDTWRQTWPLDAAAGEAEVTVPVHHAGDPVGEMVVGMDAAELSAADRQLLRQLAGPAGVALSTVRLTHALRQRAVDIEAAAAGIRASQQRLVTARADERARLRHRVDTSVQPHVTTARDLLERCRPGPVTGAEITEATAALAQGLDELRTVARGIFPARLAEGGVVDALRMWAAQGDRPVQLSLPPDTDGTGLDPDLAAALYFCAVTALANPSSGSSLTVDLTGDRATLDVCGRIDPILLQGVIDRAEAFGGRVTSERGDPETIRVEMPVSCEPGT